MPSLSVSNEAVLGIAALISLGVCLNGWRFARMKNNPWTGKKLFGLPVEGHDLSIQQVNRIGYLQVIVAPIFFLLFAAIVMFGGVTFDG